MEKDKCYYTDKFNDSYERIFSFNNRFDGVDEDFYDYFYHCFISSSPEVTLSFSCSDVERQKKMLKTSFVYLVNIEACNLSLSTIENIGRGYSANGYHISPEVYDCWLDSLIQAVQVFDPLFNEDVDQAWRMFMASGISLMKHYCDDEAVKINPPFDSPIDQPNLRS